MCKKNELHPFIQTAIDYLGNPNRPSYKEIGWTHGVSAQAAKKRVDQAIDYFRDFDKKPETDHIRRLQRRIDLLEALCADLRQKLCLNSAVIFLLTLFKDRVLKFYPKIQIRRFRAYQKLHLLWALEKYRRLGGSLKDFCEAIDKSPSTISDWVKRYDKYGLGGLADKITRPHNYGNRIPVWLKKQILALFILYPKWTAHQHHRYMKHNPAICRSVSLPTIRKMLDIHKRTRQKNKDRIKKHWAFDRNFDVWIVDFTTLIKTDRYKLQLLTVSDSRSRYLFDQALFLDTSTNGVMEHLEHLFLKYGRPQMIKADNGQEFRLDFRRQLEPMAIYLLNSPTYWPKFCGSHERAHRTLKGYIDKFADHRDFMKLTKQIMSFTDHFNHTWSLDILGDKTPAEIYFKQPNFVPDGVEVVTPYVKDGELRMKFTNRKGLPARMAIEKIEDAHA